MSRSLRQELAIARRRLAAISINRGDLTMTSFSDSPAPGEAREQWHHDAAERDAARLTEGPDDDTETDDSPWREQPEPVEPTAEEEFAGRMDAADRATRAEHDAARDEVLRPYRFTGGPWDGKSTEHPRAFSSPHHCMPTRDQIPGHGTWAAADAWPGRNRYAPDGTDGDVVLMTWRLPTGGELADAKVRREIRDEEKLQEFALDAAADAAADAATDGA